MKRPRIERQPRSSKVPRVAVNPEGFYERNPAWRVKRLELVEPYGWHILDEIAVRDVRERLAAFETMTWGDILVKAKKQNHQIPVRDLCVQAQKRLLALNLGDIEQLLSLRISGKERIWGILQEGVLQLLWWDPEHQICPSILRNT